MTTQPFIKANWPAPKNISAFTTTRHHGESLGAFAQNNLAFHVNDNPSHVETNRKQLKNKFNLKNEPIWLEQTHSATCIIAEETNLRIADAAITRQKETPLAIMTADCLPILLCNKQGTEIAAIHAGWRGLANGIIQNTLKQMQNETKNLLAWIGPGICGQCYQVSESLKQTFVSISHDFERAFSSEASGIYADLIKIACIILKQQHVKLINTSQICTLENKDDFYSYRADSQTGRIASLIWLN